MQVTDHSYKPDHLKNINRLVKHVKDTIDLKIKFVTLDKATLRLVVFSDGSFARNEELSSQSGFIVLMAD